MARARQGQQVRMIRIIAELKGQRGCVEDQAKPNRQSGGKAKLRFAPEPNHLENSRRQQRQPQQDRHTCCEFKITEKAQEPRRRHHVHPDYRRVR